MSKDKDWNDKLKLVGKDKLKEEFNKLEEESENVIDQIDNMISIDAAIDEEDKVIRELNHKHIFVNNLGGKNFVTHMTYDDVTERKELELVQVDTFKGIYQHRTIADKDGKKVSTIAQYWLSNTKRRYVDSLIYDPSRSPYDIIKKEDEIYLNTWAGYYAPNKPTKWSKTKRHIYKILCNSDCMKFKYVIKWLAWMVQNPDKAAGVVLVFKGERGGGKSFLFVQFKRLFARHGMVISDPSRLTGKFSSHFENLSYLFCDEVYYPGNKEVEGRMKSLITEEFIDVESKFQNARMVKNRLHIVMCTNNDWVIPAASGERRYFIEEINNMYAMDRTPNKIRNAYHKALWDEMDNGGREAMLKDLLNYNLGNWHPRSNIPQTRELQNQKEMSLNALYQAVKSMLEDGVFPGEHKRMSYCISAEGFSNYLDKLDPYCGKFSAMKKAKIIKDLGATKRKSDGRILWEFPSLKEMRSTFNKKIMRVAWDDTDKWQVIKSEF